MKRLLVLLTGALLLALVVAGAAAAGPALTGPSAPHQVTTFSPGEWGSFAEGMAGDSQGRLWVSLTAWGYYDETTADSNIGEVWRVALNGDKKLVATIDLSPNGMLVGVAVDRRDRVYVGVFDFGDPQTLGNGIYRVTPGRSLTKVVALPAGSWPNGLAFHDGRLYITDSTLGAVWRVRIGGGIAKPAAPWLQDALLAPGDPQTDETMWGLGANGLAFRGGRLFVSVSDYGRIVRIPVRRDGSPGTPRTICEGAALRTADGIAFDALGGLWVTTNAGTTGASPSGALYRLTPAAGLWRIADDPGWLNYPTMPVFGTTAVSRSTLYLQNGAYFSYEDGTAPDVRALRVGIPGLPLF